MKLKKYLYFIAIIMFLGVICTFAMAPLCVPDEEMHSNNAMYISNLILKAIGHNDLRVPSALDQIVCFRDGKETVSFWTDWTTGQELVDSDFGAQWLGTMPFFPYFWSGLFLTITRLIGAPYQMILVISRLANLFFYAVIAAFSIYICPRMKWAIMTVSFLPSTVWIVNSFSYDMWNTAFAVIYVAYIAHCMTLDKIKIRNILGIFAFLALFLPTKFIYFPMSLLIFLPSYKTLDRNTKRIVIIFGGLALSTIAGVLWYLRGPEIISFLGDSIDFRAADGNSNAYSLSTIFHHPLHVFYVYVATIIKYSQEHFTKSVCGENYSQYVPGMLQFTLVTVVALLITGSLNVIRADDSMSYNERNIFLGKRIRIIAVLVFVINTIAIAFSFLLMFSRYSEGYFQVIEGIQGRYYLPLFLIIPFISSNRFWNPTEKTMKRLVITLVALNVIVTFCKFAGVMES